MVQRVPQNWYPDPTGRNDLRYWDGIQWTSHVVFQHVQSVEPLAYQSFIAAHRQGRVVQEGKTNKKVVRQVRKSNIRSRGWRGGGTLLTERVFVINQKPKRIECLAEYTIFDQKGRRLGEVRETGLNFLLSTATFHSTESRKRTLEVVDDTGAVIYRLKRPAKYFSPQVELSYADGRRVGTFSQNNIFSRKISLEIGREVIGHIVFDRDTFRATVRDSAGRKVASVSRIWAGRRAERRTRADNYVIEIAEQALGNPLLGFVVTAAVAIDTIYQQGEPSKQDAKRERRDRRFYGV